MKKRTCDDEYDYEDEEDNDHDSLIDIYILRECLSFSLLEFFY